jgi:hypothetical protein
MPDRMLADAEKGIGPEWPDLASPDTETEPPTGPDDDYEPPPPPPPEARAP